MSKSFKQSRNEETEWRRQQLLRDRDYLKHMRQLVEQAEIEQEIKLQEYRRLKGELS